MKSISDLIPMAAARVATTAAPESPPAVTSSGPPPGTPDRPAPAVAAVPSPSIGSLLPLVSPAEPESDLFPITPPIGDMKTITAPASDLKPITEAQRDLKTITGASTRKRSPDAVRGDMARKMRAARALLDWSQEDFAAAARVGVATIRRLEAAGPEGWQTTEGNAQAIIDALKSAGVSTVRLKDGRFGVFLKPSAPPAPPDDTGREGEG